MTSRSQVVARIDCQPAPDCTLTQNRPTYIEVEKSFNDGSIQRARMGAADKRYELNAQLRSRDGRCVVSYGGMGVTMPVKAAARFSAKALATLPVSFDMIEQEVTRVCQMAGLTLSQKGQAQMQQLRETMVSTA